MSLLLKKVLVAPMIEDFAFFILVSISMSSFNSSVMMDPRYLNFFTKWTLLLLARMISSRRMFLLKSCLACWSEGWKNMALDFDF